MAKKISRNARTKHEHPVAELTDEQIWDIFRQVIPENHEENDGRKVEFDWCDLEGKIIGKSRQIVNPRPYNSNIGATNPVYFQIIQFADKEGSMLLFEPRMLEDVNYGYFVHSYYFNGKTVLYSGDLF